MWPPVTSVPGARNVNTVSAAQAGLTDPATSSSAFNEIPSLIFSCLEESQAASCSLSPAVPSGRRRLP